MIRNRDWKKVTNAVVSMLFGLLVILAAAGVGLAIYTSHQNQALIQKSITVSNHHHAEVAKQNASIYASGQVIIGLEKQTAAAIEDHTQTLNEVLALQQEVTTVIAGLPAADAVLKSFAISLTAVETWVEGCLSTGNCANPPAISTP